MKRSLLSIALIVVLAAPSVAFAGGRRPFHPFRGQPHYHRSVRGGDVALGILGGIVGGVLLHHVLTETQPAYVSPPGDPYDYGYDTGYRRGVRRGQRERYRAGARDGYDDGVRAGRYGWRSRDW